MQMGAAYLRLPMTNMIGVNIGLIGEYHAF